MTSKIEVFLILAFIKICIIFIDAVCVLRHRSSAVDGFECILLLSLRAFYYLSYSELFYDPYIDYII